MNEDTVLDALAFQAMSQKELVALIVDRVGVLGRREWVTRHIAYLAERYGHLGVSQRRLSALVYKEQKRRFNRERRNEWLSRS